MDTQTIAVAPRYSLKQVADMCQRAYPLLQSAATSLKIPPGVEVDDLIAEAWAHVHSKIQEYDPAKGMALESWAAMIGRSKMIDALLKHTRRGAYEEREVSNDSAQKEESLLAKAEEFRAKAEIACAGDKRLPGGQGIGQRAKIAIALMIAYTGWSSRKLVRALDSDFQLRTALGLPSTPSNVTVSQAASALTLTIKLKRIVPKRRLARV